MFTAAWFTIAKIRKQPVSMTNKENVMCVYVCVCVCMCVLLSHVQIFAIPRTVAHQAPLSTGILQTRILEWVDISFSRDLPHLGTEPGSSALQADSLLSEPQRNPYTKREREKNPIQPWKGEPAIGNNMDGSWGHFIKLKSNSVWSHLCVGLKQTNKNPDS